MKIGFIGLGAMGYPMAGFIGGAFPVTVWNRTHAVAERHAAQHGTTAVSQLSALSDCDVIITMLPTSVEVDAIVEQLAASLAPGTFWIDATSGDPVASRAAAERLAKRDITLIDAPVTGGTKGAETGNLTIMIGASDEAFQRADAILRPSAGKIVHVGPVGSGHAIKAINNAMLAANLWAAAEGLLSLKQLGFDMKVALDVINAATGRSNVTENLIPKRLVDGQWPVTFKLALLDKDVRIATSLLHSQHLSSPLLSLVSQMFTASLRELGSEADHVDVLKTVARMSGTSWTDGEKTKNT